MEGDRLSGARSPLLVLARRLAVKTALLMAALLSVVLAEALFFQFGFYYYYCPGITYLQCWESLYLPPPPSVSVPSKGLSAVIARTFRAYGFGEPVWVRFFDYVRLMLTSNFGPNAGSSSLPGTVSQTISARLPYTLLMVVASALEVVAMGVVLRLVSVRGGSSRRPGRAVAGAAASTAAVSWLLAWGIADGNRAVDSALRNIVPSRYVPLVVATHHMAGVAYDFAVLESMALPFVYLTAIGLLGLLFARLLSRQKVDLAAALALAVVSGVSWSLVIEPFFDWPGLGQALYYSATTFDFSLGQAVVFEMSLMAFLSIFAIYAARDAGRFLADRAAAAGLHNGSVPLTAQVPPG